MANKTRARKIEAKLPAFAKKEAFEADKVVAVKSKGKTKSYVNGKKVK